MFLSDIFKKSSMIAEETQQELPAKVVDMIKKIAASSATPEHKKAAIDALVAKSNKQGLAEAPDSDFLKFMNTSLGNKVDSKVPSKKTGLDSYDNAKTMSQDSAGYGAALKFSITTLQKLTPGQKVKLSTRGEDGVVTWLTNQAKKQGLVPDTFVEEDIDESQDFLSDIFKDPAITSWALLLTNGEPLPKRPGKAPFKIVMNKGMAPRKNPDGSMNGGGYSAADDVIVDIVDSKSEADDMFNGLVSKNPTYYFWMRDADGWLINQHQPPLPRPKTEGVAEGTNDYFKRRKDEEDRIAGTKAPAKRTPRQTDYEKKRKEQGVAEDVGAQELQVGDPVVITGNVEYQGKTGDVRELSRDGSFVVVDLYNYGPYSFHSSDVRLNDYDDSDDDRAQDVAEGVKIVDQDSDLDQQVYTLMVDGVKVSFTYWDYEDNFQNPDIKDIYQQAREQLGKKLSLEQIKEVARAVFKSFEQGVAEGSGESYIIVRTDSEGKKDVFAGNFDTYEQAQKELDGLLAHPLHTKYKQKFEIKRKGGEQGVAEATGDKSFDSMMKKVTKAPNAKQRNAERIRQKREREEDSRNRSANAFGTSPADKLSIRSKGVAEGMFGIDSKAKGAIQNVVAKLSDIPGMWDHAAQTFTDAGMDKLKTVLKNNPKHMKYAVNLTADDFDADLNENKFHPINDDDFYEYNVDTKEIVSHVSGKHPEARRFTSGMMQREWPGRDDKHKFIRGINAKYLKEATEYGIPDSTPGQLPGGAKITFGEFKKMWPNIILKRPSGGSLAGSVVADVEGWMNNPKSVWEPLKGVFEVSNATLRSYSKKAEKELATPGGPVKQKRVDGVVRAANKRYAKDSAEVYGKVKESLRRGEYYVHTVHFADGSTGQIKTTNDEQTDAAIKAFYAKQGKTVVKVDYNWSIKGEQEVLDEVRKKKKSSTKKKRTYGGYFYPGYGYGDGDTGGDGGGGESRMNETRLYYTVSNTLSESLRKDFKMSKDRNGWFLPENAAAKTKLTAERAFGEPAVVEADLLRPLKMKAPTDPVSSSKTRNKYKNPAKMTQIKQ